MGGVTHRRGWSYTDVGVAMKGVIHRREWSYTDVGVVKQQWEE